jgi:hypothetical protein
MHQRSWDRLCQAWFEAVENYQSVLDQDLTGIGLSIERSLRRRGKLIR